MSVSEQRLWAFIQKDRLGYRFRRNISVGDYYIDFYCAAAQLAIEVDGEQHKYRVELDQLRDDFLRSCGIQVIRIPSLDLFEPDGKKLGTWIDLIVDTCERRVSEFDELRISKQADKAK